MVYIFKTSVRTEKDVLKLKPFLNKLLPEGKWTFDLDDCDKVLRVISNREIADLLMAHLADNGFDCGELE